MKFLQLLNFIKMWLFGRAPTFRSLASWCSSYIFISANIASSISRKKTIVYTSNNIIVLICIAVISHISSSWSPSQPQAWSHVFNSFSYCTFERQHGWGWPCQSNPFGKSRTLFAARMMLMIATGSSRQEWWYIVIVILNDSMKQK